MLYLFQRAKVALCAFGVLFLLAGVAQASVITLAKVGNPTEELQAVKDAFHSYGGIIDFDIDQLIYLGKFEPDQFITNGQYAATEEGAGTPNSIFTLSDVGLDDDDELVTVSVGFGPELMLALLVVDGNETLTNLYFDNMFSNVTVGDNKAISHLTAFGYLQGGGGVMPAVPVPAALPLFGTGIALMGLLNWRRKRKAS